MIDGQDVDGAVVGDAGPGVAFSYARGGRDGPEVDGPVLYRGHGLDLGGEVQSTAVVTVGADTPLAAVDAVPQQAERVVDGEFIERHRPGRHHFGSVEVAQCLVAGADEP